MNFKLVTQLRGRTDFHSHILPGVDDGVKTLEESLQVLTRYETVGIAEVWCTPHVMEDIPNTTEELKARFIELQSAYKGPVQLHLAAEYMLDELFEKRLAQQDLLPLGNEGNQLLVETSYFNPPMELKSMLQRILSAGYFPVLAHPERYVYMTPDKYQSLKQMGIRFQLNWASLIGFYGRTVQSNARWLLKQGYYNFSGSDLHALKHVEFWNKRTFLSLDKHII